MFIILLGLVAGSFLLPGKDRLSFAFFDLFQRMTLVEEQSHVAVVHVDQSTLNRLESEGIGFPFPRQILGAVARVAAHYSAQLVVYDVFFNQPSFYGESDDKTFAELLKQSGVRAVFPEGDQQNHKNQLLPELRKVAAGVGTVNSKNDSDGVFRRYLDGDSLANVVFRILRPSVKNNPPQFLRFYEDDSLPNTSLYNVVKAYRDLENGNTLSVDLSPLAGRIWIVGYTAAGLYDLKAIPNNSKAPGVLIPATAIANMLQGDGLRALSNVYGLAICLVSAILSMLCVRRHGAPSWSIAGVLFVSTLVCLGISFVLWTGGTWFSPVAPAATSLIAGVLTLAWVFQTEWRHTILITKTLQHSMSGEMLELIRRGEVTVNRFGETRDVTVLFSDLVGFTELSEKLTPEQLVTVLNEYFDEVVDLVTENSGYVDKFVGDAVMALWGAPVAQNNHAQLAYNSAKQFQQTIDRFNEKIRRTQPDFKPLGTRIGLHSGEAVVGNFGARHRYNYTAIGDTVNLASRLESLCKAYHISIILSEDFVQQANALNHSDVIEIDRVMVKGKSNPTRIYTTHPSMDEQKKKKHLEGLHAYYAGNWHQALFALADIDFAPSQIIAMRCKKAIPHGTLPEWKDGVWLYDTK